MSRIVPRIGVNAARYLLVGATFGLMFPVLAAALRLDLGTSEPLLAQLGALHRADPLIGIIDTAPFFLGLFAFIAGRRQDRVVALVAERDGIIAEQTAALRRQADDLRRQAEELEARAASAEEVDRLKSVFLATMSHELRTPLNAVIGLTEVLIDEVDEAQRETVALILLGGHQLLDSLNALLTYSRLRAEGVEVQLCEASPQEVVQASLPLFESLARHKALDLSFRCLSPEARARLDPIAFGQVLSNLVGNAIKFTAEGSVDIVLDADEDHVILEVKDTGSGIPAAQLPHIFEEFRQVSFGPRRAHDGSGLGLTITRHLVEAMDGEVSVDSTEGAGSCFSVRLPRAKGALALSA